MFTAFSISLGLLTFPQLSARNAKLESDNKVETVKTESASTYMEVATALYDSLNLEEAGLSEEAMQLAIKGYENLSDAGKVETEGILTIADFSQSSRKKRLYVIDMNNYKLLQNTYVAHGKNSGLDMATKFSNIMESNQSSLGFYKTTNTYQGKHGLSLRMQGLDKGFNDRAFDRAIVVHGSNYIGDHRLNSSYMGRSFGCPAVPQAQVNKLVNTIKDGTILFIYHPTAKYLENSRVLNG